MESADVAEDLEEDFLGDVGGVGGVLQAARNEGVERLRVLGDEEREGLFGALLESRDERRVLNAETDRACEIAHPRARLHSGVS